MPTPTLLCKQCNYANEPERVYCHQCGAKLDRAILPPEATKRVDPEEVRQRVKTIVRPSRLPGRWTLINLGISVAVAAVLAALFLMVLAPANVPQLSEDETMNAPSIAEDTDAMIEGGGLHSVKYTEAQVNAFLKYSLKPKDQSLSLLSYRFEQAYVHFQEGRVQVTAVDSLFGYPFYFSTTQSVSIVKHQLVIVPSEGSVGRLRLPAKAMPAVQRIFSFLWSPLDADKKLTARLAAIAFHPGSVEMTGGGGS
jgi:hypothetical protein